MADGRQPTTVLAILSLLMAFASISTDIYLPAMPAMADALGTSPGVLEWTISGYLVGFSLGQLAWGPISDRYGRRIPTAIGIVIFVIGSAGCAVASGSAEIIGWRLVQAFGACAGVVLARAMVRDLYEGDKAASMLSTLMVAMGIAPLIGPIIGGQILALAGWRVIFWTLVGVGIATLCALALLPETLGADRRSGLSFSRSLKSYGVLLRNRRFMAFSCAGGFFFAGTFAYVAGSPFAYISYYHVPTSFYGFLFGAGIIGVMIGNLVNARLVARFGISRMLSIGAGLAALAGCALAVTAATDMGGLVGLVVPLFVFVSMTGLVIANSFAGALTDFSEMAGSASALVGPIQYGSGMIGSALVGALADGTAWPLGSVIAVAGLGSFACAMCALNLSKIHG
jgi:DHA1 family bicyclomycin/chloramphenicol resistance-like MFS transporter